MHKLLSTIQTVIILALLVICGVLGYRLYSDNYSTKPVTKNVQPTTVPTSNTNEPDITTAPVDSVPDFTFANNKSDNPADVQEAIGIIRDYSPTGYRVSKNNTSLVYMNVDRMVLMDVKTKKEKELLSFTDWPKNERSTNNECVPGSAFVKPMFSNNEDSIYFGGPRDGKDALYMTTIAQPNARFITTTENCISDIAVSTDGNLIAYQTTTHFGTGAGYVTDIYLVQSNGERNQKIAMQGKIPQTPLSKDPAVKDFAPAQIVWISPTVFYMKGYVGGGFTGIWKYDTNKKIFELVTNLQGGP